MGSFFGIVALLVGFLVPKDLLKELSDTYADVIELQSVLNMPIKKLIEFVKEDRVKIIGYVDREEER